MFSRLYYAFVMISTNKLVTKLNIKLDETEIVQNFRKIEYVSNSREICPTILSILAYFSLLF